MAENKDYVVSYVENGKINISADAIMMMVSASIQDVDGAVCVPNLAPKEIAEWFGVKTSSKGIKITEKDGETCIFADIYIKQGYNVLEVSKKVQSSVKSALESMTGMSISSVDINVCGVSYDKK